MNAEHVVAWFNEHEAVLSGVAALVAIIAIVLSPLRGTLARLLTRAPGDAARKGTSAPARVSNPDASPTVGVTPIRAISDSDDVERLSQGLREDLIAGLTQQSALAVLPGGDEPVDFRLEGSVRSAGHRVRLSFTLCDTASNCAVWSQRFDRELSDLLDLEDEIATNVANAVRIQIKARAFDKLRESPDRSLSVPELLDKAAGIFVTGYDHNDEADAALGLALERAPDDSMAIAMKVMCEWRDRELSPLDLPEELATRWLAEASRAASIDPSSYFARLILAVMQQDVRGDFSSALFEAESALAQNPKFTQALAIKGLVECHLHDASSGLRVLERAIEATPEDPHRFRHFREKAIALWMAGRADEAAKDADRLVRLAPELLRNRLVAAALLELAGRHAEAQHQIEVLLDAEPHLSLTTIRPNRFHDPVLRDRFVEALTHAGLPEQATPR